MYNTASSTIPSQSEKNAQKFLDEAHKHFANHKTSNPASKLMIWGIQTVTSPYRLAAFKNLLQAYKETLQPEFKDEKLREQILAEIILTTYYTLFENKMGYVDKLIGEFENFCNQENREFCKIIYNHLVAMKENKIFVDTTPESFNAFLAVTDALITQHKYAAELDFDVTKLEHYDKFLPDAIKTIVKNFSESMNLNQRAEILQKLESGLCESLAAAWRKFIENRESAELSKRLTMSLEVCKELPAVVTPPAFVIYDNIQLLRIFLYLQHLPDEELWDTLEKKYSDKKQEENSNNPPLTCLLLATQTLDSEAAKRASSYLANYYEKTQKPLTTLWEVLSKHMGIMQTRLDLAHCYVDFAVRTNLQTWISHSPKAPIENSIEYIQRPNKNAREKNEHQIIIANCMLVLADIFYLRKNVTHLEAALQVQMWAKPAIQANTMILEIKEDALRKIFATNYDNIYRKHIQLREVLMALVDLFVAQSNENLKIDEAIDKVFQACESLIDSYTEAKLNLVNDLIWARDSFKKTNVSVTVAQGLKQEKPSSYAIIPQLAQKFVDEKVEQQGINSSLHAETQPQNLPTASATANNVSTISSSPANSPSLFGGIGRKLIQDVANKKAQALRESLNIEPPNPPSPSSQISSATTTFTQSQTVPYNQYS